MGKTIVQFGFRNILHSMLQGKVVLDCRVLRNPYKPGVPDETLIARVEQDPLFKALVARGVDLLTNHYDRLYIGCEFGRHRSGAVAHAIQSATGAEIRKI